MEPIIYLTNLSPTVDDSQISDTFMHYGEILKIEILRNHVGTCIGFGYVEYARSESALAASVNVTREIGGYLVKIKMGEFAPKQNVEETVQPNESEANPPSGPLDASHSNEHEDPVQELNINRHLTTKIYRYLTSIVQYIVFFLIFLVKIHLMLSMKQSIGFIVVYSIVGVIQVSGFGGALYTLLKLKLIPKEDNHENRRQSNKHNRNMKLIILLIIAVHGALEAIVLLQMEAVFLGESEAHSESINALNRQVIWNQEKQNATQHQMEKLSSDFRYMEGQLDMIKTLLFNRTNI